MRRYFLSILIGTATLGFAQTEEPLSDYSMELSWGPLIEVENSRQNSLIGVTEDAYYLHSEIGKGWFSNPGMMFTKFDLNTHEMEWSVEYDEMPEYMDEELKFMDAFFHKGSIHLFFTCHHSRNDERYLLYQEIREDGSFTEIDRISTLSTDDDDEGRIRPSYFSNLNQYLIVQYPQFDDEDVNRVVNFELLDSAFISKWYREIEFPFSFENSSVKEVTLSNEGELFVLLFKTRDRDRDEPKYDDKPNAGYFLYRINPLTDEVSEFDLGLQDVWVSEIDVESNYSSNLLMIAGTYSNEEYGQVAGTFYITINKTNYEVLASQFQEFGNRTLLHFMDEDDIADGDEIEQNFLLRNIVPREDGGAVMIFEHYVRTLHQVTNARGMVISTYYTYNYGDMILQNVNPNGTVGWTEVIEKQWYQRYAAGGGFFHIVHKDRLHIVYNDHEDNPEYWAGETDRVKTVDPDDGNIVMITIDLAGNMIYEVIDKCEDEDHLLFIPTESERVRGTKGRETLWFRSRGEEYRLGRFEFIEDQPASDTTPFRVNETP